MTEDTAMTGALSNARDGGMLVCVPSVMETQSGRLVDLLRPNPASIDLEDVAHHLALTFRYGGAIRAPYSVAAHAVLVHDLLGWLGASADLLVSGLLHDCAEAYLGDVIAPLKWAQRVAELAYWTGLKPDEAATEVNDTANGCPGGYALLADAMDAAIAERLNVDAALFDDPTVKLADMWALRIEAERLTHSEGANWRWPGELPNGGALPAGINFRHDGPWREDRDVFRALCESYGLA